MDQAKIGRFISDQRKKKKLTQEQLAERLHISNRTISRWENGKTMPDYSILNNLCKELDITITELLSAEEITKEKVVEKSNSNTLVILKELKRYKKKNESKSFILLILTASIITLTLYKLLDAQYNISTMTSSYMNITIDKKQERVKIGALDGYTIYAESLNINKCFFYTITGKRLLLKDAIEKKLVSIKDWQKKAITIIEAEKSQILIFENYEIILTNNNCIIKPSSLN